jgi:hypothetical protein
VHDLETALQLRVLPQVVGQPFHVQILPQRKRATVAEPLVGGGLDRGVRIDKMD